MAVIDPREVSRISSRSHTAAKKKKPGLADGDGALEDADRDHDSEEDDDEDLDLGDLLGRMMSEGEESNEGESHHGSSSSEGEREPDDHQPEPDDEDLFGVGVDERDAVSHVVVDHCDHYLLGLDCSVPLGCLGGACSKDADEVLAANLEADSRDKTELADSGEMSLVTHEASCDGCTESHVSFVRWTHRGACKGRPVRLDVFNRIIWNVPVAVPIQAFNVSHVILEKLPVSMVKAKASFRTDMPRWIMLVFRHWQARRFAGPFDHGIYTCSVCIEDELCQITTCNLT